MYSGRRAAIGGLAANSAGGANGSSGGGGSNRTRSNANATSGTQFQPKLIASQIVALQCLHYFIWTLFLQVNAVLYGNSLTVDRIFTDQYVRLWRVQGWPDTFAILLSAIAG
jgi:Integral membrane protein S linking to the trans Golgi network